MGFFVRMSKKARGVGYKRRKTATFKIDGKEFDLTKGAVFVLKAKGDRVEVQQLNRDLAAITFDADACREFLKKDAEIQKIFGMGDPAK